LWLLGFWIVEANVQALLRASDPELEPASVLHLADDGANDVAATRGFEGQASKAYDRFAEGSTVEAFAAAAAIVLACRLLLGPGAPDCNRRGSVVVC